MPMSVRAMPRKPEADLAELLAQITPGDLQYTFFANSGAEANEGALKLARLATGRTEFVAAEGAFHGKTMGALSASGREKYKTPFQPLVPGCIHRPSGAVEGPGDQPVPSLVHVRGKSPGLCGGHCDDPGHPGRAFG